MRIAASRSPLLALALAVVLILLWALRDIVVLVALAVLLAFVLAPIVELVTRIRLPRGARLPRGVVSFFVVAGLVVVVVWALSLGVPRMALEVGRLAERIPGTVLKLLLAASDYAARHGLSAHVDPVIESLRANATTHLEAAGVAVVRWAGRLFGNLGQVVHILLLPVLTFYLLAEGEDVKDSMLRFLPAGARSRVSPIERAVNRALSSYVRGQAIVCIIMGIAVGTALKIAGFPGATVLGVMVGFAEIVPFLGFWTAMTAIVLIGFGVSPSLALTGFAIYSMINVINGYFILPRVMGRHLKMHPFAIIVSVLSGATLLGPIGVFIALPGAAVVQGLIEELANPGEAATAGAANPGQPRDAAGR
jgi:predicted PurR-regulated permease PerM